VQNYKKDRDWADERGKQHHQSTTRKADASKELRSLKTSQHGQKDDNTTV